jgi:hypothetical protein
MGETDAVLWSFLYFYHTDKANACIHCSPVRFSPITFRLFIELESGWTEGEDITQEMAEVKNHLNKYELDKGR